MPVVPVLPSVTGGTYTTSQVSALVAAVNFIMKKPICRTRANAAQSVGTAAFTSLAFQVEDVDTDPDGIGGHDNSTNNSRYTARYPGWYVVSPGAEFAASATGRRGVRLAINGTLVDASGTLIPATAASTCVVSGGAEEIFLNTGDYVEAQAFQDSGGALNVGTAVGTESNSRMNIEWVRLS